MANTRVAAEVGLRNLAMHAGYRDLWRFERHFEGPPADTGLAIGTSMAVDQFTLTLTLDDGEPGVSVRKGTRVWKAIPAAVRRSQAYATLMERVDELRAQALRVKESLERALVDEDRFTREDLADMARLPAARPVVATLVWRTPAGYGWPWTRSRQSSFPKMRDADVFVSKALLGKSDD